MEVELFEERRWENAGLGMALIRDGNGTRSFETLMRYRNAAMAEFMRALRTLKALQAEPAADLHAHAAGADLARETHLVTPAAAPAPMRAQPPRPAARRASAADLPNEPEPLMAYPLPEHPMTGPALHEPPPPAMPNEPEPPMAYPLPQHPLGTSPRHPQCRTNPSADR
jgi:hypothetical protein